MSRSPTSLYASLPLPPGSQKIRVLDLCCPKNVTPAEPLAGTLRVVDLADSPAFTALSYVWGVHSTPPSTLRCNGSDLPITENCRAGLVSLRQQQQQQQQFGPLIIWVDAICINQRDDAEKAGQIGLMEEIYTRAWTVYIWLGTGDERSDRAVARLRRAARGRTRSPAIPWTEGKGPRSVAGDVCRTICSALAVSHRSWRLEKRPLILVRRMAAYLKNDGFFTTPYQPASLEEGGTSAGDLGALLDRPWLQRVWTFQEVILASNPVVVCGTRAISWRELQQGLDFLGCRSYFRSDGDVLVDWRLLAPDHVGTLQSWRSLLMVWRRISRPLSWNGQELRRCPVKTSSENGGCSAQDYEKLQLNLELLCVYGFLLTSVLVAGVEALWIVGAVLVTLRADYPLLAVFVPLIVLWGAYVFLCIVLGGTTGGPMAWSTDQARLGDDITLIGVLDALRQRHASNAKDRAFAIHGVLRRLGVPVRPGDYGKSLGAVYHELFRDFLKWRPALILLLVDVGPRLDDAPSWVPDWSTLSSRQWWSQSDVYAPMRERGVVFRNLIEWKSDHEITVLALVLGTASYCTGPLRSGQVPADTSATPDSLRYAITVLAEWIGGVIRNTPGGEADNGIPHAVLSCLQGGAGVESTPALSWTGPSGEATFNAWYRIMAHGATASPATLQWIIDELRRNAALWKFTEQLCQELSPVRGFFSSRDGHLGSCPLDMKQGDTIAVVGGVSMPLVLRARDPDSYAVVGPAFVCGFRYDVSGFAAATQGREWQLVTLV